MSIYEEIFKESGFSPTQLEIIKLVGNSKIALEIGSSSGYMTEAFLKNKCVVDVIEISKDAVRKLPKKVRKIINLSIEDENVFKLLAKDYDFIVLADVLEHLVNPDKVLKKLSQIASQKLKILISMPNIAGWPMRKQLFFNGDFKYQESGILDKTHLRFYSVNTISKLLIDNGWRVEKIMGTITRLPFEKTLTSIPVFGWILNKLLYKPLADKYKNLSYYHFLVIAHK